ncbi:hypothetical protein B484DRAFT_480399 [Ochromonadaceae sp. CCMP2298]|nr:hypothetical protein B484DRAFT_480399 [Ochromonadaceae sp. CCMP2298]|mmetsp:Transcript_12044/g.26814  ORF Transcript_12044/g.26814 Transcript_12044/m.26814 type:complete len:302 (-) Transcript_12044:1004-1909(-)
MLPGRLWRPLRAVCALRAGTHSRRPLCRAHSYLDANLILLEDAIDADAERTLSAFLEPLLSRKRYEGNHWDDVIQLYKEVELSNYKVPDDVRDILASVQRTIERRLGGEIHFLSPHVIDLAPEGFIGPHIDSIKFSGGLICGLSLGTSRVMALTLSQEPSPPSPIPDSKLAEAVREVDIHEVDNRVVMLESDHVGAVRAVGTAVGTADSKADSVYVTGEGLFFDSTKEREGTEPVSEISKLPTCVYLRLPPRSLYLLRGPWRYSYNHSIFNAEQEAQQGGFLVNSESPVSQRTSIIFRDSK